MKTVEPSEAILSQEPAAKARAWKKQRQDNWRKLLQLERQHAKNCNTGQLTTQLHKCIIKTLDTTVAKMTKVETC